VTARRSACWRVLASDVARGQVTVSEYAELRCDAVTLLDGERAAPPEATPGRGIDDPRRLVTQTLLWRLLVK
jgi:hypothetical protein